MNTRSCRSLAMISRAIVFESAMSVPTSIPSQRSANDADSVCRGSTTIKQVPFSIPGRTWWKKMGCAARAFDPHIRMRSVCSTSRYELVPPPAPKTVARPATDGACQVRLQQSMLLLPRTWRESFWAAKLTSLVAFEQLKTPMGARSAPGREARAARKPATVRSSASSHVAGRSSAPFVSRTRGWVSRTYDFGTMPPRFGSLPAGWPTSRVYRRRARRPARGAPKFMRPGRRAAITIRAGSREERMGESQVIQAPIEADDGQMFCYRHPDRETWVRCGRCDRPICVKCSIQGPVGFRCRDCGLMKNDPLTTFRPAQLGLAVGVSLLAGTVAGVIAGQLGFFSIVVSYFAGGLIVEAVRRVVGF